MGRFADRYQDRGSASRDRAIAIAALAIEGISRQANAPLDWRAAGGGEMDVDLKLAAELVATVKVHGESGGVVITVEKAEDIGGVSVAVEYGPEVARQVLDQVGQYIFGVLSILEASGAAMTRGVLAYQMGVDPRSVPDAAIDAVQDEAAGRSQGGRN